MTIKNIKGLARKANFYLWTKVRLVNARSYNEVKSILLEEIERRESHKCDSPCEQNKIHKEKIQQAVNILRLMRYCR